MSDLILFSIGTVVTVFTVLAVLAVGRIDPAEANTVTKDDVDGRRVR